MTLRPVEFHILLALAADESHGYGLLQAVASLTAGELQLEARALYRALHRMLKDGWVAESARRPAADQDDERRRYYRLTPAGGGGGGAGGCGARAAEGRLARRVCPPPGSGSGRGPAPLLPAATGGPPRRVGGSGSPLAPGHD